MWMQIGTLLVTLVGIGAGANWFAGRSVRRLRDLKGHADLFVLLPEGPAKDRFETHLNLRVTTHIFENENPQVRRWLALVSFASGVAAVAATALLVVTVWALFEDRVWHRIPIFDVVLVPVIVGGWAIARWALGRARGAVEELRVKMEQEVPGSQE